MSIAYKSGIKHNQSINYIYLLRGSHCGYRMVVGYTTTCANSANHNQCCEFELHSWRGVLDITLCDKVCLEQSGSCHHLIGN